MELLPINSRAPQLAELPVRVAGFELATREQLQLIR